MYYHVVKRSWNDAKLCLIVYKVICAQDAVEKLPSYPCMLNLVGFVLSLFRICMLIPYN